MYEKLLSGKGITIAIVILALGVVTVILYQVIKANNDVTDSAAAIEKGAIGASIGNNITGFAGSIWNGIKSWWKGSSPAAGDGSNAADTGA